MTADPSRAPGAIVLARHGEPALSRRVKLDAKGYRRWWALYEAGGLLAGQSPPPQLSELARTARLVTSTRRRSIETARALRPAAVFEEEALMVEAPLPPPPLPSWLKFAPRAWGVISRASWWLGAHGREESRKQATVRAAEAAQRLEQMALEGRDVLVVAHGYFNAMVGAQLKRRGWRCVDDGGFAYWSSRRFERI